MSEFIFTSESVSEGHPDKMADQVSDAILDAILAEDQHARVACETLFKTGMAVIAGEITTSAKPDYEQIIRDTYEKGLKERSTLMEEVKRLHETNLRLGEDAQNGAVAPTAPSALRFLL